MSKHYPEHFKQKVLAYAVTHTSVRDTQGRYTTSMKFHISVSTIRRWQDPKADEESRKRAKQHYYDNKEHHLTMDRQYKERNSKESRRYMKKWHKQHPGYHAASQRTRFGCNLVAKVVHCLRVRIHHALKIKGTGRSAHTRKLIGCTIPQLRKHLESQFQPGMSWSNYGKDGWDMDHIIPCVDFDLTDPKQQKQCFHYTNLQPMWHADNMRKAAKAA